MPVAPPTRCPTPGCPTLTPGGPCPEHQRKPWATRSKHWGNGSTRAWRKARAEQLARHPRCQRCGQPATEVDHKQPKALGGAHLEPANLQSLCATCHLEKTRAEATARRRRR